MDGKTMLCLDSATMDNPVELGLADECLEAQPWLRVYCDAAQARSALRGEAGWRDVWVLSSDEMDGINLAAALQRERRNAKVELISFGASGSVSSRCKAAGIGLMRGRGEFVRAYSNRKDQAQCGACAADSTSSGSGGNSTDPCSSDCGAEPVALTDISLEEPPCVVSDGIPSIGCTSEALASEVQNGCGQASFSVPKRSAGTPGRAHGAVPASRVDAIAHATFAKADSTRESVVIAVVSGSGGSGKSAIAAACAVRFQAMGKRTLLLDADLQFGDMAYLLGHETAFDIADLMADPERISQVEPEDGLPALLASPKRLEESEIIASRMSELIGFLRGHFEIIVVNTGAFWSEQHAQLIEAADTTLFVLDQRPSSIRACSHALDLCARCGIATQSFRYLLNFCSRHALLTALDVSCALQGVQVEEIRDGGKEVGELLGAGLPRDLLNSKNAFSESIRKLCGQLAPTTDVGRAKASEAVVVPKRRRFSLLGGRRAACL